MINKSKKPKYYKIADDLRDKINSGTEPDPDLRIRKLAEDYKCSLYTVQQAIELLRKEGLLEVRHGSKISVKPVENNGIILNLLPDWEEFDNVTFASQLFFGATTQSSSYGWTTESSIYHSQAALFNRVKEMNLKKYKGLVCGNLCYDLVLNYLKENDIKVVTTNRHSPFAELPRTVDDFTQGFDLLVKELKRRGIKKPFILPMGVDDPTYGPAASTLVEVFSNHGIELPENRILHLDYGHFFSNETNLMLEGIYGKIINSDFIFTFTPNLLQHLLKWFADKQVNLRSTTTLGTLSILSIPLTEADIILESDILEHGRQAVRMLRKWDNSSEVPENSPIPLKLKVTAKNTN